MRKFLWMGVLLANVFCLQEVRAAVPDNDGTNTIRQNLAAAFQKVRENDYLVGTRMLENSIANPDFQKLPRAEQLRVLDAAYSGLRSADPRYAAGVLTAFIRRWPEQVSSIDEDLLFAVSEPLQGIAGRKARMDMDNALFDANYKVLGIIEISERWCRLALQLLDGNEIERATVVSARITMPYDLIRMRIDKRFDVVTNGDTGRMDVEAAARAMADEAVMLMAAAPRSLAVVLEATDRLATVGRLQDILNITEGIPDSFNTGQGAVLYDDIGKNLSWILEARARAMIQLGQVNEGIEIWKKASLQSEGRSSNVSQRINLANALNHLGRHTEALAVLNEVGRASPYGRMGIEFIRFRAALGMNDRQAAAKSFVYMRAHQNDSKIAYLHALLLNGNMDEAGRYLVGLLNDKNERNDALFALQEYTGSGRMPSDMQLRAQIRLLVDRPNIRAAIGRVGRLEKYSIAEP